MPSDQFLDDDPTAGDFVACLGGTETLGVGVSYPYPDLLEMAIAAPCINFAWPNAGVDAMLADDLLIETASRARRTILQVPCALNLSNRFYRVHPRRNDRFIAAEGPLLALYPEVDFTEFSFTRHLLSHLMTAPDNRFAPVLAELRLTWTTSMRRLISCIESPVTLLWLAQRTPGEAANSPTLVSDPGFVTTQMLNTLGPLTQGYTQVVEPPRGRNTPISQAAHHQVVRQLTSMLGGVNLSNPLRLRAVG